MSSVSQESIAALKIAHNVALLAVYRGNFSADFRGLRSTLQIELDLGYALRFSQVMPTRFSA